MKSVLLSEKDIQMVVAIIKNTQITVKPDEMSVFLEAYNRVIKALGDAKAVENVEM